MVQSDNEHGMGYKLVDMLVVRREVSTSMIEFGKTGHTAMTMTKVLHQHASGVGCQNRRGRKIRATMKESLGHQWQRKELESRVGKSVR